MHHCRPPPEHDGINLKPKLIHQAGRKQLTHQIGASLGQKIDAVVLVFELAYRLGKVAPQRTTVLPVERIGSMCGHVLGYAVKQVSDGAAG